MRKVIRKDLLERVVNEGMVDTRAYRYIAVPQHDGERQYLDIMRIALDALDTTATLDQWEQVDRVYA